MKIVFRQTSAETGGALLEYDVIGRPRGFVTQAHVHPNQEERHEVIAGADGLALDESKRVYGVGETFDVPPGTPHRHFPAGSARATSASSCGRRSRTEAVPGAPRRARPAPGRSRSAAAEAGGGRADDRRVRARGARVAAAGRAPEGVRLDGARARVASATARRASTSSSTSGTCARRARSSSRRSPTAAPTPSGGSRSTSRSRPTARRRSAPSHARTSRASCPTT